MTTAEVLKTSNPECERAALGALILRNDQWQIVRDQIHPALIELAIDEFGTGRVSGDGLFAAESNELIFGAIAHDLGAGRSADLTTIAANLHEAGLLDKIGGAPYLASLEEDIFTPSQFGQYLEIVKRYHSRRSTSARLASASRKALLDHDAAIDDVRDTLAVVDDDRRQTLDMWDIDRIFDYKIDPSDNMLGDHLLEAGDITLVVGQQGIGKSRVVTQLVIEMIIGCQSWIGALPIHTHRPRVMIIGTENGAPRMQRELGRQLRGCTAEQRQAVKNNLRVLIPNNIQDRVLFLDDKTVVARLQATVRAFQPDIVVFDPYSSFFSGDNENDAAQTVECAMRMLRVSQAASHRTATIIVHHAKSGRAAAAGAVGYDKGAFARGSKALAGVARAQINIAPGSADDANLLVVAWGKSNNGKPFDTFAVRLDEHQMIYRVEHDFDVAAWQREVTKARPTVSSGGRPPKITLDTFISALGEGGLLYGQLKKSVKKLANVTDTPAELAIKRALADGTICEHNGVYSLYTEAKN